ncbi:zf-HC2 domain-containing protein [Mycolicibacterium sp.]|uniref:zf-HC2 domain-containing protein n=1 Tax=Mycolicibacterium sp. TaxID=2320850 RepID=UPI003D129E85
MTQFGEPRDHGLVAEHRYQTWDAAYVLGALSSEDRREYEDHLADCDRCRAAVTELSGIPGLLAMLSLDEVDALDDEAPHPPLRPEVLLSVLDKVSSRRRRARWATMTAVGLAAALALLGVVVVLRPETFGLHTQTTEQAGQMLEMSKVASTPINASIAMSSFGWGTRIDMACTYGEWSNRDAPPQNLGMVVVGHDGSRSEIATWLGISGATALPSGTTPMHIDEIAAVQLVSSPGGKVLLEKKL